MYIISARSYIIIFIHSGNSVIHDILLNQSYFDPPSATTQSHNLRTLPDGNDNVWWEAGLGNPFNLMSSNLIDEPNPDQ